MDVSLNAHNHDQFLEQFPLGSFLQTRFWKRFLALRGKKYWQLNVYDSNRLLAHCLLYTTPLFLGKSYLYSPKGPIILPTLADGEKKEAIELILSQIRDITIATRKREELFCRLEPNTQLPYLANIPVKQVDSIEPKTTIYLALDKEPDELFSNFKEKTRYNIRLAEKKSLEITWTKNDDGLRVLLSLLEKTSTRQRIRLHTRRYYKLLMKAGQEHDAVAINYASYEGKPIAANLYITHRPTITYIHGGFDYAYRDLMAPYLLHWNAMQYGIQHGFGFYDFWGYMPSDDSKPRWAGMSRFKAGFGGTVIESPGTFDFIYNPVWYTSYERMRSINRNVRRILRF